MKEQKQAPSVVKIITKYGVVQGVLGFAIFLLRTVTAMAQNRAAMVVEAVILIVLMTLAHREFRKSRDGVMSYAQGLGSGTLLATEAAVITGVLVYVYVRYINTGYIDAAIQLQRAALQHRGITGAQAERALAIVGATTTPVGVAVGSLIGGVVLGFIVSLIVSVFTQKGESRVDI